MDEPSERQDVVRAAALMVNPQGVRSGKGPGHLIPNPERKRSSQTGHEQPVLARGVKGGEIGFEHLLITRKSKAPIPPRSQVPAKHFLAAVVLQQRETQLCVAARRDVLWIRQR